MVTFNIETDLDIVNGVRGEIVKIVLDENEENYIPSQSIVYLKYLPEYILIKMILMKVSRLEGLDENVILLTSKEHSFVITQDSQCQTVVYKQLLLTVVYVPVRDLPSPCAVPIHHKVSMSAFTDYQSQGQTIKKAIIDIATLPTSCLTSFNMYVTLLWC